MKTLQTIYLWVVLVGFALCQIPTKDEREFASKLDFRDIRQVMRDTDPSGRDHNIKVTLKKHTYIPYVKWNLLLQKTGGGLISYKAKKVDVIQKEFTFEGNLVDSDSVSIVASIGSGIVANATLNAKIRDLNSKVAWVGKNYTERSISLRVNAGQLLGEVMVGEEVCKSSDSPCYYITPNPDPNPIERCYEFYPNVLHCDDRVAAFDETYFDAEVTLINDTTLDVEVEITEANSSVEVVAYDPKNNTRLFSRSPYSCLSQELWSGVGNFYKMFECIHNPEIPENQLKIRVLVVNLDQDGYVLQSALSNFDRTPVNMIPIAYIVGSFTGIALIVVLVVHWRNIRKERSR